MTSRHVMTVMGGTPSGGSPCPTGDIRCTRGASCVSFRTHPGEILEATNGERRPALEACAEAPTGVAGEVLGEAQQVTPVWVVAEARIGAVAGPAPSGGRDEEAREPPVELVRDLAERREAARADRALDAQRVAVEVVIAFERLDDEVVHREPDRPAPVGVAAEEPGVGLRGRVVDAVLLAVNRQDEGPLAVHLRERAEA